MLGLKTDSLVGAEEDGSVEELLFNGSLTMKIFSRVEAECWSTGTLVDILT